ncbi:MAG: hypothetical protein JNK63_06850 [Chthonomonas sp.]|nr:hypothetical protein [Chthonomonas sp.]
MWFVKELFSRVVAGLRRGQPLLFLMLLPVISAAQTASIQISTFPDAILADGSSTVAISVQVRNRNGSNVPDGTQVLFETTLGSVRPNLVETKNGFAQTTLTSDQIAGIAKVTASVLAYRATATVEVKFAASKDELATEQFVATLVASNRLTYSTEKRIMRADGPGQKVHLIGPGFEIFADDLQYDVLGYVVIAKGAKLIVQEKTLELSTMSLNLRDLTGVGLAATKVKVPKIIAKHPWFNIVAEERERHGPVKIANGEAVPSTEALDPTAFDFTDIDGDVTLVYAKQATIFPTKEVQFRSATVDIQGSKLLRGVPLFRVSTQSVTPVLTEEFVRVSDNAFNVDFPYYLNLSAGDSTNLRFRYGTLYSRGFGATGGMYLDFERDWTLKGDQRGRFAFLGIGRKDWGLTARQSLNLWKDASAYLQADFPANRAISGSASADSRIGKTFRASYSGSAYYAVKGADYSSYDQTLSVRRDPIRLGKSPVSVNFGVLASMRNYETSSTSLFSRSYGADVQALLATQSFRDVTLNASGRVSQLWGYNVRNGLTTGLSATLASPIGPRGSMQLMYDFSDDYFSAQTVGKHRLAADMSFDTGNFYFYSFLSKSLDRDRYNLQGDLSYRFDKRWRIGLTGTHESFLGSRYSDYGAVLAFNLGLREIGISYSKQRNRIGFEILGTPIR